ncbi:hypothetical protein C808_03597 [Lachnospiraceae bacterium M18-1]|nr:hypothetical protein C808_03597 [Lachnospiraceae bacterium M18-1]
MKRLHINYNETSNHFEKIKNVRTDLIYGDPKYIKTPWFSYIIPVFKRPDLLRQTLDSVLDQEAVDFFWDIVIVDNETEPNNPTEKLIREIDDKRILYYRNQENIGPGGNYNRCIETARGKWVAMLHGDDLIMKDHLQLMGEYIRKYQRGVRELAYISPRYTDFSKVSDLKLDRKTWKKDEICYFGRLKRLTFLDIMMTGNTVGIPSFGTVMNREIMLRTGGFQVDLGICEDVITPYKLSQKYRVYTTPKRMGFYRFEDNTCLKRQVIFDICEGMTDFREYLFERNLLTRLWSKVVRDEFFRNITIYCSHISRYGTDKMRLSDFDYIYPERKKRQGTMQNIYFRMSAIYAVLNGYTTFEEGIAWEMRRILSYLRKSGHLKIIIYGAGRAGEEVARIIKKNPEFDIACFAVTDKEGNEKRIRGIPVKQIDELIGCREKYFVIIAATIEEFDEDMQDRLQKLGFRYSCSLIKDFRIKRRRESEKMQ